MSEMTYSENAEHKFPILGSKLVKYKEKDFKTLVTELVVLPIANNPLITIAQFWSICAV